MKFLKALPLLLLLVTFAKAQDTPPTQHVTDPKQIATLLAPAKGGYGLHATSLNDGSLRAFFGTFSVTDEKSTLTLTSAISGDTGKLAAVEDEVFTIQDAMIPSAEGVKNGGVLVLVVKCTSGETTVTMQLVVYNTGRIIGLAATNQGDRFVVMGAQTTEADYENFLKQAEAFHDAILADKGDHAAEFYAAWGQNKPLPTFPQ